MISFSNTKNNFHNYDWADSDINKIEIEYNCVKLYIFNDTLQKNFVVNCSGFIGMTDLCIWDDQIIDYAEVIEIEDPKHSPFTEEIFSAYGINVNYGERTLKPEFLEARFTLTNQITFKIYCQAINVSEK